LLGAYGKIVVMRDGALEKSQQTKWPGDMEASYKGVELVRGLRTCLTDITQVLAENPGLRLENMKIIIERSLELKVVPASPISYERRYLALAQRDALAEATTEEFSLAIAQASVVDEDGELKLRLTGNSHLQPGGFINIYNFNPLEGHQFLVSRNGQDSKNLAHLSGVSLRSDSGGSVFFTVY
jgi:hypothetical protein